MNWFEAELKKAKPLKTINITGVEVRYISSATMDLNSSFGYEGKGCIYIKEGLPARVEEFVVQHELYHVRDKKSWWGWLGREIRANTVCGLRDPIGLMATIVASLNRDRLATYWRALRKINFKQV